MKATNALLLFTNCPLNLTQQNKGGNVDVDDDDIPKRRSRPVDDADVVEHMNHGRSTQCLSPSVYADTAPYCTYTTMTLVRMVCVTCDVARLS